MALVARDSARPAWYPLFPYMGRVRTFSAALRDRVLRFRWPGRRPAQQTARSYRQLPRAAAFVLPSSIARARCFFDLLRISGFRCWALRPFPRVGALSCGGATGTLSGAGTGGSDKRGVNGVFSLGMSIAMLSDVGFGSESSSIGTTIATVSSSAAAPINRRRARTRTASAASPVSGSVVGRAGPARVLVGGRLRFCCGARRPCNTPCEIGAMCDRAALKRCAERFR